MSLIARAAKADAARTDLPEDARGVYVAVEARPGVPLAMESLGKSDSVMLGGYGRDQAQMAAILLSEGAVGKLDRKLLEYRDENGIYNGEDTGKPKHQSLIESIGSIRLAVLRDLWADDSTDFPDQGVEYRWETWLLPETWPRFKSVAEAMGIRTGLRPLIFPDIDVVLVFATSDQMAELMDRTRAIARVGRSSTTADFFDSLPTPNQGEFVEDAAARIASTSPEDVRSVLCLLDTGVERGHPLIAPFLAVDDRHAVDPGCGEWDHVGHGTEMAGVALFGDLVPHLAGTHAIAPLHRLESVKVIPPVGENDYDQLALITRMAVETVETRRGDVQRVYSLATTTGEDTPHDGVPKIWSAELDQLSVGKDVPGGNPRLICVSAGNVGSSSGGVPSERPSVSRYPRLNDESELESPGQSWNALTIGAFTEKQVLTDTKLDGYEPIAPVGDICPVSRTASWDKTWPIKPELLMEGGQLGGRPVW